jgi:hypothetical protein
MEQHTPTTRPAGGRTGNATARTRLGGPLKALRAAGAAGATTALTGAMAVLLVSPQALPAGGPLSVQTSVKLAQRSVKLLSNSIDTAVAQLQAAQQQVMATNSQYPFMTAYDKTQLTPYIRALSMQGYTSHLSSESFGPAWNPNAVGGSVYPFSAPGTEPYTITNIPNPDDVYLSPILTPNNKTMTVTINPGPGTKDMSFQVLQGDPLSLNISGLRFYNLHDFTPNADGSYTITVGPTQTAGNWINTAGGSILFTRDTVGDWGMPHDQLDFHTPFVMPVLSNDQIASYLSQAATNLTAVNSGPVEFGFQYAMSHIPANFVTPIKETDTSPGSALMPGQLQAYGSYSLQPDQALVVKVPNVVAGYSAIQQFDAWTNNIPWVSAQGALNNSTTYQDADGYTYYVISAKDPGVANWLDNNGALDGHLMLRWQEWTGGVPTAPITTQVVNVNDVKNYLPADTPLVSADQRAADVLKRTLEYDYRQDQTLGTGWITGNLEDYQLRAALGNDRYNELFATQLNVPTILDRLSKLVPNFSTVAGAAAANPTGALSAAITNLPVFAKDISMPMILATLRIETILGQASQAIQGSLASGDLSQARAALETAARNLSTEFSTMWTDPGTSITAGFLNARDDLAVSLMNSAKYSALKPTDLLSVANQFAQLGQSASQMLSAGFSYMVNPVGYLNQNAPQPAATAAATKALSAAATTTVAPTATAAIAPAATVATGASTQAEKTAPASEAKVATATEASATPSTPEPAKTATESTVKSKTETDSTTTSSDDLAKAATKTGTAESGTAKAKPSEKAGSRVRDTVKKATAKLSGKKDAGSGSGSGSHDSNK